MSDVSLKRFALLSEFAADDLDQLMHALEPQALPADRTLFREGEDSDGLALLLAGTLQLESRRTGQRTSVRAGSALGAMSLVERGERESTAVTQTPCELLWLRRGDFRQLQDESPRTACRLLEAIAREFAILVRGQLDHFSG